MLKYCTILPFVISFIGCCINANDTSIKTSNSVKKNIKCNGKQSNINIILCKQKRLIKLQKLLEGLPDNNTNIKPIINDVKDANVLLNDITKTKYSNTELQKKINKFNNKIKHIETLYKNLFTFEDQEENDNNKKIQLKDNKNIKLSKMNNNIQSMTTLNWSKDTRNNSHVITNPFDSASNSGIDISESDPECIIIDLSNPITIQQVEDYYNYSNISKRINSDDIPIQSTITNNTNNNDDEFSSNLKIKDK